MPHFAKVLCLQPFVRNFNANEDPLRLDLIEYELRLWERVKKCQKWSHLKCQTNIAIRLLLIASQHKLVWIAST